MTVSTPRSLVVDTDTASDDAVALLQALRYPGVVVRAVTVVAGNVPVDFGVRNAQVTLALNGTADVPVYRGAAKPLLRRLETAQHVHGEDGMSGVEFHHTPWPTERVHAALALAEIAREEPGRHDLVTLGPLTNVAIALTVEPRLLALFRHTYMMIGAADGRGNVSPTGEFNAWADPESASIVFAAEGEKTMIGWDVSRKYAVLGPEEDAALRQLGRFGRFASAINRDVQAFASRISGREGYDLPDPVAMAVALNEGLIADSSHQYMEVSIDPATRGQTFADQRHPLKRPNLRVVTKIDEGAFKKELFSLLREEGQR